MSAPSQPLTSSEASLRLLPLVLAVFLGFLSIGIPLGCIPLLVHDTLKFGTVIVGVVMALQSISTLMTRQLSGVLSDNKGSKPTLMTGVLICSSSGLLYLLSGALSASHGLSLVVLLIARIVLGLGESLLLTGSLAWGVGLVGMPNAGRAMAWNGIAMYAAMALGAPGGLMLKAKWGWSAVSIGVIVFPVLGFLVAALIPKVPIVAGKRLPFYRVIGLIWKPGLGLAFATVSMAGITAFISLYYAWRGWTGSGFALAAFGGFYILSRLLFGGMPDKIGGRPVAMVSLVVEVIGQVLLWLAPTQTVALIGAAVTGFGFSLIFPSLGVEAVKRVPASNRSLALGGYVACFDIGIGVTGPVAGGLANAFDYTAVFAAGAIAAIIAMVFAYVSRAAPATEPVPAGVPQGMPMGNPAFAPQPHMAHPGNGGMPYPSQSHMPHAGNGGMPYPSQSHMPQPPNAGMPFPSQPQMSTTSGDTVAYAAPPVAPPPGNGAAPYSSSPVRAAGAASFVPPASSRPELLAGAGAASVGAMAPARAETPVAPASQPQVRAAAAGPAPGGPLANLPAGATLDRQVTIRLTQVDHARLERLSSYVGAGAIARAALLVGLDVIEEQPSVLFGEKPKRH